MTGPKIMGRHSPGYKEMSRRMMKPCDSNIPLVMTLYQLVRKDPRSANVIGYDAGYSKNIMSHWWRGGKPSIFDFENVLNTLGYRLEIVPNSKKEPK